MTLKFKRHWVSIAQGKTNTYWVSRNDDGFVLEVTAPNTFGSVENVGSYPNVTNAYAAADEIEKECQS